MPIRSHSVPFASTPAIPEDDFNATMWRLQATRHGGLPTLRGSLHNAYWPDDGGQLTQLRHTPWEGATALFFDFRLQRDLHIRLEPQDELLLTFFLAGEVKGSIGASRGHLRSLDFQRGRALLRTPNHDGGYLIQVPGACRNAFVQFRLRRAQIPLWLRSLGVHIDVHQMERLMHLNNGTVLCNAALTARVRAALERIRSQKVEALSFAPLFQAHSVELLTYVLLDLMELLRPARSSTKADGNAGLRKVRSCMDEAPARDWTVAQLAAEAGCSEAQLQRSLRADTGQSVHQYLRNARLDLAARLLRETALPVRQVSEEAGWQCHGRFGAAFRERHGMAPLAFRRVGEPN
ncbi:MAG: helix-turn-helix transcriptional regulator [Comamonadaceae bacterium]|nr:helix-turn-helix transcriptional regulator [Comamonadaceae bacterium]